MHWPGRMRPPYEMPAVPPGMRRSVLSLVYCANVATPHVESPDRRPRGRQRSAREGLRRAGTADVARRRARTCRRGRSDRRDDARSRHRRGRTTARRLGRRSAHARGASPRPGRPVRAGARAPVLVGDAEPDPVPPAWAQLPAPPFAPLEDVPRGALPFTFGPLSVVERGDATATVALEDAIAEVPRHWLARTLFRLGLHDLRLGYVETYGGMSFDDHSGGDLDVDVGRRDVPDPSRARPSVRRAPLPRRRSAGIHRTDRQLARHHLVVLRSTILRHRSIRRPCRSASRRNF